jgi:transcriptional regulator with XRE-family HTH domain
MKRKKLSVPALARALGLNQQTLYNYLAGKSELTGHCAPSRAFTYLDRA